MVYNPNGYGDSKMITFVDEANLFHQMIKGSEKFLSHSPIRFCFRQNLYPSVSAMFELLKVTFDLTADCTSARSTEKG